MRKVEIASGFTGYPNGKRRHFAAGEKPDLAEAYADLLVGKGLAKELPDEKPAAPATPAVEPVATKEKTK